jgi:peroxiredoxin Q/BCP
MISEGSKFPNFSLQDQAGKTHALKDLKGKKAVLFFYPKDDTSG